jgi:hypothetical protein
MTGETSYDHSNSTRASSFTNFTAINEYFDEDHMKIFSSESN